MKKAHRHRHRHHHHRHHYHHHHYHQHHHHYIIFFSIFFFFIACNQALDIGFVIDSSDSVTLDDYNLCLLFVADLAKYFKVSQKGTHFGAIVYSSTPQLQFSFADSNYYKTKRLEDTIKSFPYLAEGTRTDLALTLANMELFSEQGGDRPDKSDVLVVVTDGKTNPSLSQPYSAVLQPLQASFKKAHNS